MAKTPEPGELVLIEISKILPYGAFCKIVDYQGLEAFLHISEVSPGWIKNIHEHLEEGRRYVAKVYRVSEEKMLFDVSIKRVSDKERREKLEEERKEKRAQKLVGLIATKSGINQEEIIQKIYSDYSSISEFIDDIEKDGQPKSALKYDKKFIESLKSFLTESSTKTKKEIIVSKTVEVIGKGVNGLDAIKNAFNSIKLESLEVKYLGAPKYLLRAKANDHKIALKTIETAISKLASSVGVSVRQVNDQEN